MRRRIRRNKKSPNFSVEGSVNSFLAILGIFNGLLMFSPFDYLILKILSKIIEIIAVTCHTDYQVSVPFRMLLCILQSFRINYIKLYMMTIETEIAADQSCQLFITIFIFKRMMEKIFDSREYLRYEDGQSLMLILLQMSGRYDLHPGKEKYLPKEADEHSVHREWHPVTLPK